MTPKELLGWSVEDLEKLSQAELEKIFEPYLRVTRPLGKTEDNDNSKGPIKPPPKKFTPKQKEMQILEKAKRILAEHDH
jgi:hypothetical protein